jgi:hypothetical protein
MLQVRLRGTQTKTKKEKKKKDKGRKDSSFAARTVRGKKSNSKRR